MDDNGPHKPFGIFSTSLMHSVSGFSGVWSVVAADESMCPFTGNCHGWKLYIPRKPQPNGMRIYVMTVAMHGTNQVAAQSMVPDTFDHGARLPCRAVVGHFIGVIQHLKVGDRTVLVMDALFAFTDIVLTAASIGVRCCFALRASCQLVKTLVEGIKDKHHRLAFFPRQHVTVSVYRDGSNIVANLSNIMEPVQPPLAPALPMDRVRLLHDKSVWAIAALFRPQDARLLRFALSLDPAEMTRRLECPDAAAKIGMVDGAHVRRLLANPPPSVVEQLYSALPRHVVLELAARHARAMGSSDAAHEPAGGPGSSSSLSAAQPAQERDGTAPVVLPAPPRTRVPPSNEYALETDQLCAWFRQLFPAPKEDSRYPRVPDVKARLKAIQLSDKGNKLQLLRRLKEGLVGAAPDEADDANADADATGASSASGDSTSSSSTSNPALQADSTVMGARDVFTCDSRRCRCIESLSDTVNLDSVPTVRTSWFLASVDATLIPLVPGVG
mmetsp:Transcript_7849/g.33013  ORF Transcript_7849/g.33013 Transcript_7849/m.33013 type:complete len:499 (+) Transcript_7849:777-2273(+)